MGEGSQETWERNPGPCDERVPWALESSQRQMSEMGLWAPNVRTQPISARCQNHKAKRGLRPCGHEVVIFY